VLTGITNKIYLFSGENDCLATPLATKWLKKTLQNSEVISVPELGHGAFMYNKDMSYFDRVLGILHESSAK
jgi:hypothetical protein